MDSNNTNTFGNVILVIVLVLIVGFGVWYFTGRSAPTPVNEGPGIQVDIQGGNGGSAQPEEQGSLMPEPEAE